MYQHIRILILFFLSINSATASLFIHPLAVSIVLEKPFYYEGEIIKVFCTITNNDSIHSYPVLAPRNTTLKHPLLCLNVYDKANNTMLLRYSTEHSSKPLFDSLNIIHLKPLEKITFTIELNNGLAPLGIPLFAGVYKINMLYQPYGSPGSDSIYTFTNEFNKSHSSTSKLWMPEVGLPSSMADLRIKRNADTLVDIEDRTYYIKTDGYYYYYFKEPVKEIVTDLRCEHITNLPPDSCSLVRNEYFYSHFTDLFAEFMTRFDDGDIKEYRKFSDWCPDYLYTERYNEQKEITDFKCRLPDGRFYSVNYLQPQRRINTETYCNETGTTCHIITYIYSDEGELLRKEITETHPCVEFELEGKKRSAQLVQEL